jgi:hypothetical protein
VTRWSSHKKFLFSHISKNNNKQLLPSKPSNMGNVSIVNESRRAMRIAQFYNG